MQPLGKPTLPIAPAESQKVRQHVEESEGTQELIKAAIGIHDRTQVEVVFAYLPHRQGAAPGTSQSYQVDAWFFVPPATGVTPQSYPKVKFYNDLRPLLRLREPRLRYKELLGDPACSDLSPIAFIRNYIDGVRAGVVSASPELVTDEIHLFACSYLSYSFRKVKRRIGKLRRLTEATQTPEALQYFTSELEKAFGLIQKSHRILKAWRKIRTDADGLPAEMLASVRQEIALADEYCSYAFRDGVAIMMQSLPELDGWLSGEEALKLHGRLRSFLRYERQYARQSHAIWMVPDDNLEQMERYVARRSALKKHMQRVLYLDLRTKPMFAFQQQLGGMIAAGLAGGWAVSADLFIRARTGVQGGIGALGMSGFLLITALIMAYVLKDRIKEVGKNYFSSKFLSKVPDNSCSIEYRAPSGGQIVIGAIAEFTRFLTSHNVPEAVKEIRGSKTDVDPLSGNNVIHYRKKIAVNGHALSKLMHPVNAVHDILRFNLQSFLTRLDDVLHEEFAFNKRGEAVAVMMPKVYYLDMVLRYSWLLGKDDSRAESFEYIRLVLNKEGLTRVERVAQKFEKRAEPSSLE